eukprot:1147365-Ditylum_brightwellii.AAC.1
MFIDIFCDMGLLGGELIKCGEDALVCIVPIAHMMVSSKDVVCTGSSFVAKVNKTSLLTQHIGHVG